MEVYIKTTYHWRIFHHFLNCLQWCVNSNAAFVPKCSDYASFTSSVNRVTDPGINGLQYLTVFEKSVPWEVESWNIVCVGPTRRPCYFIATIKKKHFLLYYYRFGFILGYITLTYVKLTCSMQKNYFKNTFVLKLKCGALVWIRLTFDICVESSLKIKHVHFFKVIR